MLWRSTPPAHSPVGFIEPCLPTLGHAVPTGSQWAYEIKHDGFRFICRRDGERVRVFSRRGHDWTDRVPLIAKALTALRVKSVTLDGEGVVCRADGVSQFDRMRAVFGRLARV
jgi:bifunctional non-homologous end joining protein LigD